MAINDLGKVAMTFAGDYDENTTYDVLTVVVAADGQGYVTTVQNVLDVEPGVTNGWQNYWALLCQRGPRGTGIAGIARTNQQGPVDTYTITYENGETSTFTVTNGEGIQSISKTGTNANVDTYTIVYGNNQTATFTVTNAINIVPGGTDGQVLVKNGSADYATRWATPGAAFDQAVANNLTTTDPGYVLDGRQGKVLKDAVDTKVSKIETQVTLSTGGWSNKQQTVSVPQVTTSNTVICSAISSNYSAYNDNGVRPSTNQAAGQITFVCESVPTTSITVNVLILN